MASSCPNSHCSFYQKHLFQLKDGFYFRRDDAKKIQRYKCKHCLTKYSSSTQTLEYRQKKRRKNFQLRNLLASGNSMRRCAFLLKLNRKTIERKLHYLAKKAELSHAEFLQYFRDHPAKKVQFDDLITIEHTKLKPLSVSLLVERRTRFILGLEVSRIPAFGHLAKISRKKYGKRESTHTKKLHALFSKLRPFIDKEAVFESDEHKHYHPILKRYFPNARHQQYKGGRGAVVGQGELKKLYHDPLFSLNHTCAMFRANVNRLIRKTWCTTKVPEKLEQHLLIYMNFHNEMIASRMKI